MTAFVGGSSKRHKTHVEKQYEKLFIANENDVDAAFEEMPRMCVYTIVDRDGVDETSLVPATVLDSDEPITAATVARPEPPAPGDRSAKGKHSSALDKQYTVMHIMAAVGIDVDSFSARSRDAAMYHVPLATVRVYSTATRNARAAGPATAADTLLEVRPAFSQARLAGEEGGEGGGLDAGGGAVSADLRTSRSSAFNMPGTPGAGGDYEGVDEGGSGDPEIDALRAKRSLYQRMLQAVNGEGGVPTGMSMTASALRLRLANASAAAEAFKGRRVVRFETPDGAVYEYMLQNAYAVEAPSSYILRAEAELTAELASVAARAAGDRGARLGGVFVEPPPPGVHRLHLGGEIVTAVGFGGGESAAGAVGGDGSAQGGRCWNCLCNISNPGEGWFLGGFPGWGAMGLGGTPDDPLFVHYEIWLPPGSGWRWPPTMTAQQVAAVREGVTHAVRTRHGVYRGSGGGDGGGCGVSEGGLFGRRLDSSSALGDPWGTRAAGDAGVGGGVGVPLGGSQRWTVGFDGQVGEGDIALPSSGGQHFGREGLVTAGASESWHTGGGDGSGFGAPMGRGTASASAARGGLDLGEGGATDIANISFGFECVLEHVPALDTATQEAQIEAGGGQEGGYPPSTMPVIFYTVMSRSMGGKVQVRGYGSSTLPSDPGAHSVHVNTWAPEGKISSRTADFFLGGATRLSDASAVGVPRDLYTRASFEGGFSRHGLRTKNTGKLAVRLHSAYHVSDGTPRATSALQALLSGGGGSNGTRGGVAPSYRELLELFSSQAGKPEEESPKARAGRRAGDAPRPPLSLRGAADVVGRITALMQRAKQASAAVDANRTSAQESLGRGVRLRSLGTAARASVRLGGGGIAMPAPLRATGSRRFQADEGQQSD